MKITALMVLVCGLVLAGCSRAFVELHRAALSDGDFYAFIHRPSRLPFADGGELLFVLHPDKKEEWSIRVFGGYDLYTDLRLSVARSGDLLFVRDERMKRTCAINLRSRTLDNREPSSVTFVAVGQSHHR
jgi:hypothetical protein